MLRRLALARDQGHEEADSLLALAADGLMNGCEGRVGGLRQLDVIEADDADIGRDRQASIAQAASTVARIVSTLFE